MEVPYENSQTGCCPPFNPDRWDRKENIWQDKLFVKDRVKSIFHIPINFGRVMVKNMEKIQAAGAPAETPMVLCDENSLWGSDVYIAVSKDVPDSQMVKLSGTFLSRVYEGPYRNIGRWIKQMKEFVRTEGKQYKKLYICYTTCPKCAKHYGKNYVVIFALV